VKANNGTLPIQGVLEGVCSLNRVIPEHLDRIQRKLVQVFAH
jgi:hypothetical protein